MADSRADSGGGLCARLTSMGYTEQPGSAELVEHLLADLARCRQALSSMQVCRQLQVQSHALASLHSNALRQMKQLGLSA